MTDAYNDERCQVVRFFQHFGDGAIHSFDSCVLNYKGSARQLSEFDFA